MILLLEMKEILEQLRSGKVVIYPTESVFGLGCDPDNEEAIYTLLSIKRRSWKKGLILIAANYVQLLKYIDSRFLSKVQLLRVFKSWPGPVTWLFPAHPNSPYWLTGQHVSVAVRVSCFKVVQHLCLAFGKPLISTSANLSGYPPARTVMEVYNQFGCSFPIMNEKVLGRLNPSDIRDVITGKFIRR